MTARRIAVVGSGISGLSAAYRLSAHAQVTLFEAGDYFGGHTNTVDVTLPDRQGRAVTHGVDTGFLVFNDRTYPKLIALFRELGVHSTASDMSFSVQVPQIGLEWSGSNLSTVFAQRRNLFNPRFLGMLSDILRFNKLTTAMALRNEDAELREPIGAFLDRHRFGANFRDWYFLPMVGSIWSCPTSQMLAFPIGTMIRFCHNHGLIAVTNRPQWHTVTGGSKHYVQKMLPRITDARVATPVHAVHRPLTGGVDIDSTAGREHFDAVVMACHSDQSLALLADASPDERSVLSRVKYHPNRAVLHTDASVLPRSRRAWAAWNYERGDGKREDDAVCLHYLINRLQPLPFRDDVVVSLNPVRAPRSDRVLAEIEYMHPVFDQAAVDAQRELPALQGERDTWFCGAWTGYGFHEDGLKSGLEVASDLVERLRGIGAPRDATEVV